MDFQQIYQSGSYNVTGSILKHYGLPGGPSLPSLDRYLNRRYRNILLLIFDGLSVALAKQSKILSDHLVQEIYSVYPPTTTASLTTLYSGLSPIEHGWLGWNVFFPELGHDGVTLFLNTVMDSQEPAADYVVTERFLPYDSIVERVRQTGVDARNMNPFQEPRIQSVDQLFIRSLRLFHEPGRHYLVGYWTEPDYSQHEHGVQSVQAHQQVREIERSLSHYIDSYEDSLIIIMSDHGLTDATAVYLEDYPELQACLTRRVSLEARNPNFYVYPEKQAEFVTLFQANFPDFELLSHAEVLERAIYGPGTPHPTTEQSIGDFVAIAKGQRYLLNDRAHDKGFIGVHAGLTEPEMMIPLIIIERP